MRFVYFWFIETDRIKRMKRVLRRLGFTDKNNVVQLKGRVACEVNAGAQELLVVELIFNNVFSDLSVPQIAALLVSKYKKRKESECNRVYGKQL